MEAMPTRSAPKFRAKFLTSFEFKKMPPAFLGIFCAYKGFVRKIIKIIFVAGTRPLEEVYVAGEARPIL